MFKFARERRVWWDVDIQVPKDRGVEIFKTSWLFEILDAESLRKLASDPAVETSKRVHGWEGIAAEDGTPLPFSAENCRALLRELFISGPVIEAIVACSRGAEPKNSKAGSAG